MKLGFVVAIAAQALYLELKGIIPRTARYATAI